MVAFRDADPGCELVFASFVGEEVGGVGSQYAVEHGFTPDYAVVGEGSTGYSSPGVTDVAVVHRGRRASTVVAHGESAHASEADAGVNAIYRACDAVEAIRGMEPPGAYVPEADATVEGSMAVTMVDGGTAWNVITDRCDVTVDERTVPGEDGGIVGATLDRVEGEGVEVRTDQDWPTMRCDDERFVTAVQDAAAAAQEIPGASRQTPRHRRGVAGPGGHPVRRLWPLRTRRGPHRRRERLAGRAGAVLRDLSRARGVPGRGEVLRLGRGGPETRD